MLVSRKQHVSVVVTGIDRYRREKPGVGDSLFPVAISRESFRVWLHRNLAYAGGSYYPTVILDFRINSTFYR